MVTARRPGLALAHHHAVCSVEGNVLDVGAPIVFDTNILSRDRDSRGSTAVAVGCHVGGLRLLNGGQAVMEVLNTTLANVAVGVFSGADSVDSVDEPFSTSSHLESKHTNVFLPCLCVISLHGYIGRNINTWKSGDEESVKPSDPGCLTKDRAPVVSWASVALKSTSPNAVAWVSGWALSCRTTHIDELLNLILLQ